ncbi:MAG: cupin domain-containing protein [Rhodothalassiaceae bacterium]
MTPNSVRSDFSEPVSLDCETLPWLRSPMPGVARRMLDRIGGEKARATSIVRYEAGSLFSSHAHPGGEEFLVLEGLFSDETGDFGPGCYVRNPVGSGHAPFSVEGCTIFVKLMQMAPDDRSRCVIDCTTADWPDAEGGLARLELHRFGSESVAMVRLNPGTETRLDFRQGGEMLLLSGEIETAAGRARPLHWWRQPAGTSLGLASHDGALFWLKHGLPFPAGYEEKMR